MADEAEQADDGFDTVAWPDAWPDGDVGGGEVGDNEDDGEDEPKVALFGREFPKKKVFIAAGVAAAVLLAGIGGCAVLGRQPEPAATVSRQQADQAAAEEAEPEDKAMYVNVGVTAEGWDEATSSPVIAHIESDDGDVDFYHAFPANQAEPVAVGDESSCKVTYVSPVNADGSIYKVGETKTLTASEEKVSDSSSTAATLERVDAAGVTADDLTNIASQVTEAVKKGDSTLTGDKGSQVVSKVEENIKNSPAATDDVKQSVEQQSGAAQEEAKKEETTAKVPTTSGGSSSSGSGSSTNSSSGGNPNSGANQSSNQGGNTSQGGSSQQGSGSQGGNSQAGGSSSQHQHSWVAQTTTVHHDAEYTTVHHDAEYTTVHHDAETHTETVHHAAVKHEEYHYFCNNCGADITDDVHGHIMSSMLSGGNCGSWHDEYVWITDQEAYDETVTVTDRAAWDEQVLTKAAWDEHVQTKAAWDETVTSGYVCSSCGATK